MTDDATSGGEDRLHPRQRSVLLGHGKAERRLLDAYNAGKLHHAWILNGPRGIGKATLAYRFARFLLANPLKHGERRETLAIDEHDPLFRRVAAQGHSDLLTVTRSFDQRSKRLKGEIGVDDVRPVSQFLARTAGEGGYRVVVVDAADEMNANAANALLKSLEEPPPQTVFLLIAHVIGRLLPTIRSRCTRLELQPLPEETVARVLDTLPAELVPQVSTDQRNLTIRLAEGSPGRALQMLGSGSLRMFEDFSRLMASVPGIDYQRVLDFADSLRAINVIDDYRLFTDLLEQWLSRRIRDAARGIDDWNGILRPDRIGAWMDVHRAIVHSIAQANALNLDRREVIVQAFRLIDDSARA